VEFSSGVASSDCPRFGLIWLSGVVALANRMARGERLKKDKACNALRLDNAAAADDVEFVINRLEHNIKHSYKAIAELSGVLPPPTEEDLAEGGDAGAIMFAGALLAEHYHRKGK
jgi:hypothetical protein